MRVLVVEDEEKIASAIETALKQAGAEVVIAADGETGLHTTLQGGFDAIVLDIMLPKRDGLEVLQSARAALCTTPILLLSARAEVEDRILGLNQGADDYLPKPFLLDEVVARVRALARRSAPAATSLIQVADLTLDLLTREVRRSGVLINLGPRELRLLEYLMRAAGRVCTRAELHEQVWDYRPGYDPGSNVIQVGVTRLREKIDAAFLPKLIKTVVSEGYVLRAES